MAITSFEGKHRFLSNFWACPIVFPSITFPSAENAYQACKTIEPSQWAQFTTCTAGQAKRLGRD